MERDVKYGRRLRNRYREKGVEGRIAHLRYAATKGREIERKG